MLYSSPETALDHASAVLGISASAHASPKRTCRASPITSRCTTVTARIRSILSGDLELRLRAVDLCVCLHVLRRLGGVQHQLPAEPREHEGRATPAQDEELRGHRGSRAGRARRDRKCAKGDGRGPADVRPEAQVRASRTRGLGYHGAPAHLHPGTAPQEGPEPAHPVVPARLQRAVLVRGSTTPSWDSEHQNLEDLPQRCASPFAERRDRTGRSDQRADDSSEKGGREAIWKSLPFNPNDAGRPLPRRRDPDPQPQTGSPSRRRLTTRRRCGGCCTSMRELS